MKKDLIKIGIFTTANAAYWSQMPEIKDEIITYVKEIEKRLSKYGQVFNAGIVDSVEKARKAETYFISNDIDIVIIHCGTYGMSENIIPCIRRINTPIISLHLQPVDDFNDKSDSKYTMPKNPYSNAGEIGAVLNRMEKDFFPIAGRLFDETPWHKVDSIIENISLIKKLRNSNIGLIGNYYKGMCDLYIDETQLIYKFGINLEILEIGDLRKQVEKVKDEEIESEYKKVKDIFTFDKKIDKNILKWSLKVAAGMRRLIESYDLSALAFNYSGYPESIEEKIAYSMTLGGALLTGEGIPCVVEGDIMVALTMLMLGHYGGGASQAELNIVDYKNKVNYINHSGPGDISISEGKPILKWLDYYHGRRGCGVANEFSIKKGPITLLSLTQSDKNLLKFTVSEGESVEGLLLPNGNMNTRVKFNGPVEDFIERWTKSGASHHSAIGIGHNIKNIEILARVLNINTEIIK
jgi:L-arabinose isomerase